MPTEEWIFFAKQRYLISANFEDLLRKAIEKADENGYYGIGTALKNNLNDELGLSKEGKPLAIGSHEDWRRDFYTALGIKESELKKTKALKGTENYNLLVKRLINRGNFFEIIGALLFLEFSIPKEFMRIKKARDLAFPEIFVFSEDDTEDLRLKKQRSKIIY